MFAPAVPLALTEAQKEELESLVRNGATPQKVALRCRIVLLAHKGKANHAIARQMGISRPTVLALRAAFSKSGVSSVTGIRTRKRKARVLTPELEQRIVDTTPR